MPYKIRLAPRNSTVTLRMTLGMTRTCTTLTLQFPSSSFFFFSIPSIRHGFLNNHCVEG